MRGILPSPALFKKYPKARDTYGLLINSIKKGDVKSFNEALSAKQKILLRQGTYFAIEKAEAFVMRQLFKKVYLLQDSSPKIPISTFHRALEFQGFEEDIGNTEWKLASMIAKVINETIFLFSEY
jgi:hypothetical protein